MTCILVFLFFAAPPEAIEIDMLMLASIRLPRLVLIYILNFSVSQTNILILSKVNMKKNRHFKKVVITFKIVHLVTVKLEQMLHRC